MHLCIFSKVQMYNRSVWQRILLHLFFFHSISFTSKIFQLFLRDDFEATKVFLFAIQFCCFVTFVDVVKRDETLTSSRWRTPVT